MFLDWISDLTKFFKILSWAKVLQLFSILLMITGSFLVWDARALIYQHYQINQRVRVIDLSKKSITEIDAFTHSSSIVIGTQITSVDFQKNIRKVMFASIDDERMKKLYDRFLEDIKITEFPFLSNSSQSDNLRMIALLNGEFVCSPYLSTLAGHVMPEGAVVATTVCATGIPPEYGKFSGIITVYLKREPTEEERQVLESSMRDLANKIYKNDIE